MKNYYCLLLLLVSYAGCAQVETLFTRAAHYGHFNGVVIVQSQEERQYEICKGDARPGIPITTDTPFDLGSLTKQFTAAAILHLVAEGKVDLHEPINQYLGALASKPWRKVTLHHLLTHTSGIPSLYQTEQGLPLFLPATSPVSREALVARFREAKLQFTPGEEFAYSNSGYILLAVVIERISGLSFGEFLHQHIFAPYGLTSASWGPTTEGALPYYGYRADLWRPAPVYHPSWMVGAGGIYASAEDLVRWLRMIQSEDFLSADLRAEYLSSHTRAGYGYGWQISTSGYLEHDGINAGFAALVSFDPASGQQVVILTNRGFEDIHLYGKSATKIRAWADQVWAALEGQAIDDLPEKKGSAALTGKFLLPQGDTLQVSSQDTVLRLTIPGRYPTRIVVQTPLPGEEEKVRQFCRLSDLLRRGKYWKTAKYFDGEMKFVAYSGLLWIGFQQMKKRVGELRTMTPYFLNNQYGLVRMDGSEGAQDIIFYFDDEGRVQGMFEHGFYPAEKEVVMYAYPTENGFYLDGFPYGENSLVFHEEDGALHFLQHDRKLVVPKVEVASDH